MMKRIVHPIVIWMIAACSGLSIASACPFCGPAQSPLSEKLAKKDAAVVVKWMRTTLAKAASQGETEFVVTEQLGGKKKELKFAAGDKITFPRQWNAKRDDRFVLFGDDLDELTWETPQPVTDRTIAYLREAPPFETPIRERLAFYLNHLESPDPLISMDVFAEFGCAPFADVAALAPKMDRARLREIVTSDKTSAARLGLYGMMLGLCGEESDADLLRRRMDQPQQDKFLLGLDGLTFGYLTLAGAAGLDELDRSKLTPNEDNVQYASAAMSAMRVLWSEKQDRIPRERLKQSMRRLLEHRQLIDLVLADLARWNDWSVMDRLMDLDSLDGADDSRLRRSIIRYMLSASGHESKREPVGKSSSKVEQVKGEKTPIEPVIPDSVRQRAKQHVETLRKRAPGMVQNEERFHRID